MKQIRMLTTEVGAEGETLEAGSLQTLNDASAGHWLRRGKAELVKDAPAPNVPAPTEGELQTLVASAVADEQAASSVSSAPAAPAAPAGAASEEDAPSAKPSDGLTVPQIKEALAAKQIAIPDGMTLKADLAALLDAAE